jgi:adenylate cyclase
MPRNLFQSLRRSSAGWQGLLATVFAALLAAELFALQAFDTTEYRLADRFMRSHAPQYHADPAIVIVDIDDASMAAMQEIAGLWAWPREIHADLLEALSEFVPRAVVFDIAFPERDMKRPKSDARLSEALAAMPHAYLSAVQLSTPEGAGQPLQDLGLAFGAIKVGSDRAKARIELPHAVDRATWRLGLINSLEDDDGVLRRHRLYSDIEGWRLPSLAARVAREMGATLPPGADFLMRWPERGHQRYAYGELFRLLTEQRHALGATELHTLAGLFRDKVVVIGASAAGTFDHHLTPMRAGYPGVDILAIAIDNLKNGVSMQVAPAWWPFGLGLALIAALATGFARRINPAAIGAGLALASVLLVAGSHAAFGSNLLLPVATPLMFAWTLFLTGAVGGYLRERRARARAVSLFGRFLNPGVVRQIVEQGETVESLSGRAREVTVLFSDIRGFTTLSESRPPQEVVALLNRYFERQVEVVFHHGGTLDKFIGDAIMAFWGAPLDDPDHARNAVAAALAMQEDLLEFKQQLRAEGAAFEDFDIGIGLHSGAAVVGFIGAQRKLDYTAIGDAVNLASRVEGLTKGVARVLITRDTMRACGDNADFRFAARGEFQVKGRAAAVELYEPEWREHE